MSTDNEWYAINWSNSGNPRSVVIKGRQAAAKFLYDGPIKKIAEEYLGYLEASKAFLRWFVEAPEIHMGCYVDSTRNKCPDKHYIYGVDMWRCEPPIC